MTDFLQNKLVGALTAAHDGLKVIELERQLRGVSRADILEALGVLMAAGKVTKSGKTKGTRYHAKKGESQPAPKVEPTTESEVPAADPAVNPSTPDPIPSEPIPDEIPNESRLDRAFREWRSNPSNANWQPIEDVASELCSASGQNTLRVLEFLRAKIAEKTLLREFRKDTRSGREYRWVRA